VSSSGGEAAAELAALLDTATAALTAWAAADPQQLSAPALGGRLAAFGALAAQVGVAALAAADPQQLADAALGEGIVALGTVGGQLEAQRLRWLASLARRSREDRVMFGFGGGVPADPLRA